MISEFRRQMLELTDCSSTIGRGGSPAILGEVGIPFDMDKGEAFRTGDFSTEIYAMDASLQAVESSLLSATIWNYSPDNCNERGDDWNGEDLSVFSSDQRSNISDIFSGIRAPPAVIRPYAMRTAGTPTAMKFDICTGIFKFTFRSDPAVKAPTLIFVPYYHYHQSPPCISVTAGSFQYVISHRTSPCVVTALVAGLALTRKMR
mmetsp:Transcript_21952/g.34408  ORF Transcript_21952/g.34408 Transcript_21952/m.34408 type:complete len:204 (+) Transcript_21952:1106-1717(+)